MCIGFVIIKLKIESQTKPHRKVTKLKLEFSCLVSLKHGHHTAAQGLLGESKWRRPIMFSGQFLGSDYRMNLATSDHLFYMCQNLLKDEV